MTDGYSSAGELLLASDGNFYGTTQFGGQNDQGGTLFRYEPDGTFTTLHHFLGPEGAQPVGRLIEASDGFLYGRTLHGGDNDEGTIFRVDLAGNVTPLYDADVRVTSHLEERPDGFFYGTQPGRLFKMDADGNVTTVKDFPGPQLLYFDTLLLAANGDLYLSALNPNGIADATLLRLSDMAAPPELDALEPTSGSAAGGASVRLRGHHLNEGATVTFGGVSAPEAFFDREALVTVIAPPFAPGSLHDVSFESTGLASATSIAAWFADFLDVDGNQIFHDYVEAIFRKGITAGCGSGNYCPADPVTRAQMAVFLLKSEHGSDYVPPSCQGVFSDVACPSAFADWIEQLAAEDITAGCGTGIYCPQNAVTRGQMAAFLLRTEHGPGYVPPACGGLFGDVPCPSQFADWIEQLADEGVTAGCGAGNYCPDSPNTRGQMAVFLTRTFAPAP